MFQIYLFSFALSLEFWSKNYPKINSLELFNQVDKNNDGAIQLEEWVEFWSIVYRSGYTEQEISSEVLFSLIILIFLVR